MKRMKRLTAMLLVLVMMFTMAPAAMAAQPTFTDVPAGHTFYNAVMWAVEKNITQGINATQFGPTYGCTRGQVVTFLWRNAGEPEPTVTENPFTDVDETSPFYKAILWAVENNITGGYSDGTFRPKATCTRGQIVTFLHRAAGSPEPTVNVNPFRDVSASSPFYKAILWAVVEGITTGVSATAFGPNNTCTRGQVVTFMYRASDDYVPPKPVAPPTSAADRFEIAAAYIREINQFEGVEIDIFWRNNTGRALADIKFYVQVLDYNGNVLTNRYGGNTFECYVMYPPFPSGNGTHYYIGEEKVGNGTRPDFSSLSYDEEKDAYYWLDFSNGMERVYVSPANLNHRYVYTDWQAIMYNGRASRIQIERVVLTYTDNSTETIMWPTVGPRTSPAQDKIYTQQLYNSLGCDVVGHAKNPTCTESVFCDRCKQTLPATGHTWAGYGDAYCSVCGEDFVVAVELWEGLLPEPVKSKDSRGNDYTFSFTGAGLADGDRFKSYGVNGAAEIRFDLTVWYNYSGQGSWYNYDDFDTTVSLRNEQGEVVFTKDFTARASGSYSEMQVTLPANGKYFIDVTLDCDAIGHDAKPTCTEGAECTRCNRMIPAKGHDYNDEQVCTVCGEGFVADITLINTIIPGVQEGTPGVFSAYDDQKREYVLKMTGVYRNEDRPLRTKVVDGAIIVEADLNVPFVFESVDQGCEIPGRYVQHHFYSDDGELVLEVGYDADPADTNKELTVELPGNGTYYVETFTYSHTGVDWG